MMSGLRDTQLNAIFSNPSPSQEFIVRVVGNAIDEEIENPAG